MCETTRETMESYWKQHAKQASVEEMMLDSNAEELGKEEIPEILSMMPDTAGMHVLELGAGIGSETANNICSSAFLFARKL